MGAQITLEANAATGRTTRAIASYLPTTARILLGLVFFMTGLNGFLDFLPHPTTPLPEKAVVFFSALFGTGYMIPLISFTEAAVGALLLSNRFVTLALAVLAPVMVNIIAFHTFLSPSGAGLPLLLLVLELYLAWAYRKAYRPMLAMRTE
jgi:uncharacterized membrane protein YphA (DoxX/SURF4 family)